MAETAPAVGFIGAGTTGGPMVRLMVARGHGDADNAAIVHLYGERDERPGADASPAPRLRKTPAASRTGPR